MHLPGVLRGKMPYIQFQYVNAVPIDGQSLPRAPGLCDDCMAAMLLIFIGKVLNDHAKMQILK